MFHQVFICNTTEDPDCSRDLILEQNSLTNDPQILKQENTTLGSATMGCVQTEDFKMAVEELKSEQYTVINNQILMKTDTQIAEVGLESNNFLNVTPCSNTVFPVSQTGQELILPVTAGEVIQPFHTTLTSSPAQMIIQQKLQTAVIPPLVPTYIYQSPVKNIALQPQPTLINMNGNLVQLSAPPVPLQTGAVVDPATQVISAGLTHSPTMKTERSSSLSNMGMSGEVKGEKTLTTNSQVKTEREEEPMEDADLADSGNTEVHHNAVKFQEFNGTKTSIKRHKIRHSGTEKKEEMSSTTDMTNMASEVQLKQINLKLQKDCGYKRIKISDDELRLVYNIKESIVVINRSISEYLTPETILDSSLENNIEPFSNEYEDSSVSDLEEHHTDTDTDVDVSSGSDWEEVYLGKLSKTQKRLENVISKKTVNIGQNLNFTNHSTQKTNEPCSESVGCSFEEGNSLSKTLGAYKGNSKINLNSATCKSTSSLHYRIASPLHVSVQTTIKNTRSLQFIPLSNIMSNTDSQQNSHDKIQAQTVTFTNVRPIDAYKSNKDIRESKQKDNKIPPLSAEDNRNDLKRLTLENSMLTPKAVVNGPCVVGGVDTFLLSSSPSHAEESILKDNQVPDAKNKNKSKKITFQLKLPFKSKLNNMKLKFIPKNKIVSITDRQILPSKNIQAQAVSFAEFHPVNACKKGGKTLTQAKLNQKNCIISPPAQNNKNQTQRNTHRKILPKSRAVPSASQPISVVNRPSATTPPSQDNRRCKREARHQCDICDKRFTSRDKLEGHKNSHTNARPFKCFDCDKFFNSKVARQMHHKSMHLNKKTRYLCCFCGYITPSPEHLLAHEEAHRLPEGTEGPKPFKCLVCGKGFISRWKQQHHKKEHQFKKCAKCSETFKTYAQLRNHMEAEHSIIKTYDCKKCGMQFKHPETLRSHRTTHSSVLVYFCEICDKGFKRKSNLKQHMITHSKERPITCPECGDSFKRITHLKQHTAAFHGDGRK